MRDLYNWRDGIIPQLSAEWPDVLGAHNQLVVLVETGTVT